MTSSAHVLGMDLPGGWGVLYFFSMHIDPASTVNPKEYLDYQAYPQKYLKF